MHLFIPLLAGSQIFLSIIALNLHSTFSLLRDFSYFLIFGNVLILKEMLDFFPCIHNNKPTWFFINPARMQAYLISLEGDPLFFYDRDEVYCPSTKYN